MSSPSVPTRISMFWIAVLPAVAAYATVSVWAESTKRKSGNVRVEVAALGEIGASDDGYSHLPLSIETIELSSLGTRDLVAPVGAPIYVEIVPGASGWRAAAVASTEPRDERALFLVGTVRAREPSRITVDYGIDPVPIAEARFLASLSKKHSLTADLSVSKTGRCVLCDVYVDGARWDEWRATSRRAR